MSALNGPLVNLILTVVRTCQRGIETEELDLAAVLRWILEILHRQLVLFLTAFRA